MNSILLRVDLFLDQRTSTRSGDLGRSALGGQPSRLTASWPTGMGWASCLQESW